MSFYVRFVVNCCIQYRYNNVDAPTALIIHFYNNVLNILIIEETFFQFKFNAKTQKILSFEGQNFSDEFPSIKDYKIKKEH